MVWAGGSIPIPEKCLQQTVSNTLYPRLKGKGIKFQQLLTKLTIREFWLSSRGFAHVLSCLRWWWWWRKSEWCCPWSGRWRGDSRGGKLVRWRRWSTVTKTWKDRTGEHQCSAWLKCLKIFQTPLNPRCLCTSTHWSPPTAQKSQQLTLHR